MKTLILSPIIAIDVEDRGVFTSITHLPAYEMLVRLHGLQPLSLYSLLGDRTDELPQMTEDEIRSVMLDGLTQCDQVLLCAGFDRCPIMFQIMRAALHCADVKILAYEELQDMEVIGFDNSTSIGIHLRKFWNDLNTRFDKHWGWFFSNGYKSIENARQNEAA
jgi:hypothetical protein